MFDFKGLGAAPKSEAPSSLAELFGQLDRKTTHSSLRPVQVSALGALDGLASQRDVVLKLSTGSGKTVVGLVYAEMMRRRYRGEPSVFLCPTTQLVEQVVHSGASIGVQVVPFGKNTPFEALSGEVVLACTYDRLFNARSVFVSRNIRPSCFVLDDVHAGVDRVRGCYTTKVPAGAFDELLSMLRPLCESTDPAAWHAIGASAADTTYEVPFWVWANTHKQVFALLEKFKDDDTEDIFFRWGNLARYSEIARVCLTGQYAEISLPLAAVEENSAYTKARHRLFMSASIKDGSSLVADLGCAPAALQNIIDPPEDEGAGERMILPTSLIAAGAQKPDVADVCAAFAKSTNVVVLTSSRAQASEWIKTGATLSEGKGVDQAIETLRKSSHNFAVFAQRFDGVDLPDDACRLLVIDGVPSGDRICDKVDSNRQKDSPEYEIRTVNRFEQALGRAVRSNADYAAVLLVGADIGAFIGKKSVRDIFEGRTRVQVDLGRELAKLKPGQALKDVLHGLVQALLTRNEDWKEAHRARVKAAPRTIRPAGELTIYEQVAVAQRDSWLAAKGRNFQNAVAILREATNLPDLHTVQKAELLYRIATYLHQFDPAGAAVAYRAAFELNSDFPRPDQVVDKRFARVSEQAAEVAGYFGKFIAANAALARLDEIKSKLSYGMPADLVEQGLCELGRALGATSSRPEKETGRGPDVMWLFDDVALCIEAKSEKTAPIHKSDAAQLVLSLQWCEQHVDVDKSSIHPIFATNTTNAERSEDIAFGPRIMNEATAFELVDGLRQLVMGLSFDGPLFGDPTNVAKALATRELLGKQVLNRLKVMKG